MNPYLDAILQKVSSLRKRVLLIRILEGVILCSALWIFLWMAGPLPLSLMQGWPGIAWRLVVLAAAAGVLILLLARIIYPGYSDDRLALAVEKTYPGLNNSLISSLQLARERDNPDPRHRFSSFLVDLLIKNTASKIEGVELSRVATLERLKWRFLSLCLSLLAAIVVHNFYPGYLNEGLDLLVLSDFDLPEREGPVGLTLPAEPLTTADFKLEYIYPAYSGLEPQTVRNSTGDITALKGTEVNIETSCLERVSSANLVVGGSARIPLEVDDQQRLRGSFVVNEAGEYFIEADDVDDVHRAELEAHMINIDDDLYPGITLKEPISDLEVNAEDIVLLAFEAEDDFGVGGVSLVFQRAAEEQRIEIFGPQDASGLLARGAQARKNLRGEYDWGLADAGVVPGERISFYLEVEDNDNISGPKSSRSATLYLEVFSALKKHEEVLSALEDLFEKMIGQLALHLDDSLNLDEPPAGYVLKKVEHDLISKGREMMADIQSVLDMAEKDDYSGELILNSLENMIDTYKKLLALREDLARRFTRASRPGKGLKDLRQEYTEALEADIIFLDRMIKKQRLDMVVMEGKNLALAQQELAELLDKYRASKDPALLAELQRKMAELEAAVNELLDRMAKMRSEMGDEFFNVEALEGPGLKDTLDKMSLLRNALRDGDMEFALSHAEDFLNALSEMMAAMEERAGEYGEMLSMDAIRRMDDVIDRLASLESMEQGMIDRSEEMYEDQLQRMNKLDSMFESFISKESEKIDELVQKLARLQAETRNLYPRREPEGARDETIKKTREFYRDRNSMANRLRSIQRQLAQRKDELEGRELEDMLERMKNNQSSLELAQKDLEGMLEDFQAQPEESREECSSQCSKARNLGQEIIEDVEGWMERFKTALAAGDTAELKGMAYEQEDIRDQTLKAWEEIDDLAQEIPAIPLETMEKLDKASLSMRDASGYLLLEDVGKALTPEREAKAKLGQAREDLENARRQLSEMAQAGGGTPLAFGGRSGGGRSGRGSGAGGLRMDDFKIPRAGGEDEPRELREALLKAMREDSPERYRDLNHDYYERLMR